MKKRIVLFLTLIAAAITTYAGVVYYGPGRAVFLENIIQFANFFELEATGIKNLRVGGELAAHNIQAANVDKNFIPIGAFETSDEDFTSYVDAAGVSPVDGTGGGASSFLTCAQSSTTPLEGNGSLNMVKFNTASGGQGHGCSYDFTVSTAGQAQGMTLSFDYKWTDVAANEDGDFRVYIYDVDKSVLIEPVPFEINRSSFVTKYISGFMTDATSTNYRIIFHLAQDRAGVFSLKVDNLFVGKSTYARGAPITDWEDYTPTFSHASGTMTNYTSTGKWRRIGDSAEIKIYIQWSGASSTFGALYAHIPSHLSIDYTKLGQNQTTAAGERNGGLGSILDVGVVEYQLRTKVELGNRIAIRPVLDNAQGTGYGGVGNLNDSTPFAIGAGDYLNASITVPILGWSSNVVMSETMPGRDVVLNLVGDGTTQTIANLTSTVVTTFKVREDTSGIWDAATNTITIPETGFYDVSGLIGATLTGSTGDIFRANLTLQRVLPSTFQNTTWTGNYMPSVPGEAFKSYFVPVSGTALKLVKGETYQLSWYGVSHNGDSFAVGGAANFQHFRIAKRSSGSQTIGLEETVLQKVSQQLPATLGAAGSLLRSNGTTAAWDSSIHVAADGNVGIGTSSPNVSGYTNALTIRSNSQSALEISSTRADTQGAGLGALNWIYETNSTGHKLVSQIATIADGATANQRGGALAFYTKANASTSSTERMRIDSSGNVGIGVAPSAKLDIQGSSGVYTRLGTTTSSFYTVHNGSTDTFMYTQEAAALRLGTSATERMRIDSSGNVTIGDTASLGKFTVYGSGALGQIIQRNTSATAGKIWYTGPNADNAYINYNHNGTGAYILDGGTTWIANSDERLKDIIEPIADGLSKVNTLRTVIGKYKTDEEGVRRSFLIAQDVQAVLPEVVSIIPGTEDKLGLDYDGVIPLLVKAIQELSEQNAALIARIEALEAR